MKKFVAIMMLIVFVVAFAGSTLAAHIVAPPVDPICIVGCVDGQLIICCYEYIYERHSWILVENCYTDGVC